MSTMQYPHLLDELAYELLRGREWPVPPWLGPTLPLAPRVKRPPPRPPKPIEPLCYTYGPTGFVGRLSVHVGLLHIGDVVVFPTGYRAYLPDDTPVEGLHVDRETAARALEVGRS